MSAIDEAASRLLTEKELEIGIDMSSDTGRRFKKDPSINVISKEEFEERIEKVFHLLWKTLSKSFGPYGAPTLIYNYPYSHVTKDGYTIMKNLSMDASETLVDQAIANMASDICGRLNYSVGDGTTTAVISTNSIYQNYRSRRNSLTKNFVLPRDVIKKYEVIKEKVIAKLQNNVRVIRSENLDELRQNIYDVVYVSSNGDEVMTNYIADLYHELGCPAISCELASDGVTKKKLINGYQYDLSLTDKLYINSDDNTMKLDNADIIIFSTKINKSTYENILVPLNMHCKMRGRHLIVAAPYYDEIALKQIISRDLNNEYSKTKNINMILMVYKAVSTHTRKLIEDFAVLTNTTVIDKNLEKSLIEDLTVNGKNIFEVFNLDRREIPGLRSFAYNEDMSRQCGFNYGVDELPEGFNPPELAEHFIRLGYAKDCSLGLKNSLFSEFYYDENRYNAICRDAEQCLADTEARYQKLGTFNIEVSQAQQRLYALKLKMGIIEVGADSELSQKLIKDAVDDAIRAAASAFNHGVILGCNVNLIQCILSLFEESDNPVDNTLLSILSEGFKDVYRTVLGNAFSDYVIEDAYHDDTIDYVIIKRALLENYGINSEEVFSDVKAFEQTIKNIIKNYGNKVSIHNIIIEYSILTNQVFDVSRKTYSNKVINSAQTDEEILKATIDLISLLITGNQMVVTMKHNF